MNATAESAIRLIPLGGVGEFGLHMMLMESGNDLVAIDCGLMFPDEEMLGINYAIPDFSYVLGKRETFRAVFLTHGHYDHIGALPYLLREVSVPVYGTPLTLGILARLLQEHKLLHRSDLRPIRPRDVIELGSLRIESVRVTHSVADGIGFGIETSVGTIVHTGDFKLDQHPIDGNFSDYQRLAELGNQGVLCLLSDSTNVERPGHTPSEREVGMALAEIFKRARRRIIISTFATHIHRIQQVIDVAAHLGRKVALLGRSMVNNARIAEELGYLRVPEGVLVSLEEFAGLPAYRQVIISTGSQAEPNSAIALIAAEKHRVVQIEKGDLVILSARVIPGNERHIAKVINDLFRLGAEVLYEQMDFVHASGHACQEDLKSMLNLTRPRFFIPVHGEYRHLIHHARLAESVGIPKEHIFVIEDGKGVELTKNTGRVIGPFPVGRIFVDGKGMGDVGDAVIRDRQRLAEEGVVVVVMALDRQCGKLMAGPQIVCSGFVHEQDSKALVDGLQTMVCAVLENSSEAERIDPLLMPQRVKTAVKKQLQKEIERRPLILPVIVLV